MPNPTAPQLVFVWPYDAYDFGSGLPVITRFGTLVSSQITLDAVIAKAATFNPPISLTFKNPTTAPTAATPSTLDLLAIEKQRTIQDSEKRSKYPLSTEPSSVTASATGDVSLTKFYSFDATGQATNSTVVMTAAQLAAVPFDLGHPAAQHVLYRTGGTFGYHLATVSKDPAIIPVSPNQNPVMLNTIRFRTNAVKFAALMYRILGATIMGHKLYVNGQPYTFRPQAGSAGVDYLYVNFPDSQYRDIEIKTTAYFGGIYMNPIYEAVKPTPRAGLTMYTYGDSYSAPLIWVDAGTNNSGLYDESLAAQMDDYIGGGEHYIDAIGGTGFLTRTNGYQGTSNNYEDRLPQMQRVVPDVLWIPNGAANDIFYGNALQTIADSVRRVCLAARNVSPKCKIVMGNGHTPPTSFGSLGSSMQALQALLLTQLADIGTYQYDSSGFITGTGTANSKNASGNSDWIVGYDGIHGTGIGYLALKQRHAYKLRRALVDDGTLLNTLI